MAYESFDATEAEPRFLAIFQAAQKFECAGSFPPSTSSDSNEPG